VAMADNVQVSCIKKRVHKTPHERIQGLGGLHNSTRWYQPEDDIIAELEKPSATRRCRLPFIGVSHKSVKPCPLPLYKAHFSVSFGIPFTVTGALFLARRGGIAFIGCGPTARAPRSAASKRRLVSASSNRSSFSIVGLLP